MRASASRLWRSRGLEQPPITRGCSTSPLPLPLQGIVWGTNTELTARDERLINRFDYDGEYGTVLNRFLMQVYTLAAFCYLALEVGILTSDWHGNKLLTVSQHLVSGPFSWTHFFPYLDVSRRLAGSRSPSTEPVARPAPSSISRTLASALSSPLPTRPLPRVIGEPSKFSTR